MVFEVIKSLRIKSRWNFSKGSLMTLARGRYLLVRNLVLNLHPTAYSSTRFKKVKSFFFPRFHQRQEILLTEKKANEQMNELEKNHHQSIYLN